MPRRKKSVVRKYQALGRWERGGWQELLGLKDGLILRALFREDEISFDWAGEDDDSKAVQSTHLLTTDGIHFTGTTQWLPGYGEDTADAEAVLYSNPQGHFLIGQCVWRLEASVESFIVQFHDEQIVKA